MLKSIFFLLISLSYTVSFSQENVVFFFNTIYNEYKDDCYKKYDVKNFLFDDQNNINYNKELDYEIIYKLYFLHQLFTTNAAQDCSGSGILSIPYFWAESRNNISAPKKSKILDRTPAIFLSDLVSIYPKYSHEGCGLFHTFGWCAEREMAFVALLRNMGFKADVIASNGHAWTQVNINLDDTEEGNLFIKIDNTFNNFSIGEYIMPSTHNCKSYNYNCEVCLMQKYYNPRANEKIDNIIVSTIAAKRIRTKINNYFNKTSHLK